jgi:tetratricopeptide (TPR) repeat protein
MLGSLSHRFLVVASAIFLSLSWAAAQKTGKTPINSNPSAPSVAGSTARPVYVSGNVLIEGAGVPPDPVPIQRLCNGMARRVGYTDSKGQFVIDIGSNTVEQDSSENDTAGGLQQINKPSGGVTQSRYEGCELVASLAGFQSTSVILQGQDDFGQMRVGTIILKRLSNVEGSTISMTSMAASKDARQAYEKGRKARSENKLEQAEKELNKAVELYSNYAAAWALLGEIHTVQNRLEEAIKEYMRATACDAQFVTPYFGLAIIAVNQQRWQDAANFSDQTMHLNGYAYPTAYFYNAVANFHLNNFDVAERSGRKFQTLDSDHRHPDIALLISQILTARQDYAGAIEQLRNYLALAPTAGNADQVRAQIARLESLSAAQPK